MTPDIVKKSKSAIKLQTLGLKGYCHYKITECALTQECNVCFADVTCVIGMTSSMVASDGYRT